MLARSATLTLPSPPRDLSFIFDPGLLARLHTALRRTSLDRALAAGDDPTTTPALAARAAQLTCPDTRREIAAVLEGLAGTAAAHATGRRFGIRPATEAMARNRTLLRELAELLRADVPVYASGVAALRLLAIDGAGPAYTDRTGTNLTQALRSARAELQTDRA